MSGIGVQKDFTKPLLKRLNRDMRSDMQGQPGQLLILDNVKELGDTLERMIPGFKVDKTTKPSLIRALKKGRKKALELQNQVPKRRLSSIKRRLPIVLPESKFRLGVNVFVLQNFYSSIKTVKDIIFDTLVDSGILTKEQANKASPELHKGHGVYGNAVVQSKVASTFAGLSSDQLSLVKQGLEAFGSTAEYKDDAEQILKLMTKHSQIVTKKGSLKAQYFSIVSFQDGASNALDKEDEQRLRRSYEKFLKNAPEFIPDMKGSSTMKEKVVAYLGHEFTSKSKNVKATFKKAELKSSGTSKASNQRKKPKVSIRNRRSNVKVRTKSNGINSQPLALIQAFNAKLPDKIAANMKSPRLNYRTGRFADSVKVLDIQSTPQGFLSFGYTYQKNPYQTFEPGFAQGDPDRDPRKLIDRSMREIAAEFAIGRFYTRRL